LAGWRPSAGIASLNTRPLGASASPSEGAPFDTAQPPTSPSPSGLVPDVPPQSFAGSESATLCEPSPASLARGSIRGRALPIPKTRLSPMAIPRLHAYAAESPAAAPAFRLPWHSAGDAVALQQLVTAWGSGGGAARASVSLQRPLRTGAAAVHPAFDKESGEEHEAIPEPSVRGLSRAPLPLRTPSNLAVGAPPAAWGSSVPLRIMSGDASSPRLSSRVLASAHGSLATSRDATSLSTSRSGWPAAAPQALVPLSSLAAPAGGVTGTGRWDTDSSAPGHGSLRRAAQRDPFVRPATVSGSLARHDR